MLTFALKGNLTRKTASPVLTLSTGEACLSSLNEKPPIIILDYFLTTVSTEAANGMEILLAKKNKPDFNVTILSSQKKYDVALQTIQKNAEQYVTRDESAFEEIVRHVNETC